MEGNVSKIHGQEFPRLILPLCSPCGERRGSLPPPPCMGSFNPRSPCGERPESEIRQVTPCSVSIHAPRVGSDIILCCNAKVARKFQSTLPVWGATPSLPNYATEHMFQSTLPVWGATAKMHKILFLISEEYVDSAKRQAVGLNIKGNLPFIPSAF